MFNGLPAGVDFAVLDGSPRGSDGVAARSALIAAMLAQTSFCYYHFIIGNVTSM